MRRKFCFLFFFLLIFFIIDRFFKNILLKKENFLFFELTRNSNFFFFFKGIFFYFLILIIFLLLIFFLSKSYLKNNFANFLSLSLIFVGGFSNLWDRFLYGFVIDYFNFSSLLSFNLSDIIIILGASLFLIKLFRSKISSFEF